MELRPGPAMLTDYALDAYVAPELSRLGIPELPSLASLATVAVKWLPDFLLNHMLRFVLPPRERQFRFALIRRTAAAIAEYELGRNALGEYVRNPLRHVISPYFSALRHLEAAVAVTYQAQALGAALVDPKKPLFEDDSSPCGRLWKVYVHSRHADDLFDSAQVVPEQSLTVWLTNDGLACAGATVRYVELSAMIEELGRISEFLVDPSIPRPEDPGPATGHPFPVA